MSTLVGLLITIATIGAGVVVGLWASKRFGRA